MSNLGNLSSRAIIGEYYRLLELGPQNWVRDVGSYFRSDQPSEEYKWLGMSPAMREWVDGRMAKGLRDNGIVLRNKPYESTLEISIDDLRRDKTGQIMARVADHVARANEHWEDLLISLIEAGESTTCYDGQLFFDVDHSEGSSGTQSNDLSVDISALPVPDTAHGSTTAPAAEEMMLAILEAAQAIIGFKDDQGKGMNRGARNFAVLVPPSFWAATQAALGAQYLSAGQSNVIQVAASRDGFNFNAVPIVGTSWTTKFAVVRRDGNVKPFILQEEVEPEISAIAEGSELEFNRRVHRYGIYASRNVGYGYWQHACLVTLA